MKKFFFAFLVLLISRNSITALARNPLDYATVYVDETGRTVTVYNLGLMPEDFLVDTESENKSNAASPFKTFSLGLDKTAMLSSQIGNLNMKVSLLYNDKYSEKVLLSGKDLTVEILAQNTVEGIAPIQILTVFYTADNRLVNMNYKNETIGTDLKTVSSTTTVPQNSEVSSAKIMIWNDFGGMTPYSTPILLTLNSKDYFGDDYTISQPLNNRSEAVGNINDKDDVDAFEFTAQKDGLYIFESYGDTNTYAELRSGATANTVLQTDDNSGSNNNFRLSATLTAGQRYYLYVYGHNTGDYLLRSMYAIGNIIGTVSPVKYYDVDYKFNTAIGAKVTLSTFDTNNFVAAMHLKDWSTSDSEYATFDMTGIHAGTYLVSITRPGYLTRYRKIVLNDNAIDLGNITLLAGDVNGDGTIDMADSTLLQSLYNKEYGQTGYNIAADLNGDKIINSTDLALLSQNLNKNANIYNENVNVIKVFANISGSNLNISGTATKDSVVTINVHQGDIGLFSEYVTADANGNYQITFPLSRAGLYEIVATSDNRVIDATTTINY